MIKVADSTKQMRVW